MEVGLGIHGEPGLEKAKVKPCGETAKIVVDKILACLKPDDLKDGKKLAVLVNNLGAVPPMEMTIFVKDVFAALPQGVQKFLVGPAPLMTSLDMNGVSVTLMPLNDDEVMKHMLAPCGSHCAWPHVSDAPCALANPESYPKDPLSTGSNDDQASLKSDEKLDKLIKAVCEHLVAKESELNALDSKVGDGDTGTQMSLGARGVLAAIEKGTLGTGEDASLSRAHLQISKILAREMGGSSGVLLSIMFSSMASALKSGDCSLTQALNSGIKSIQEYGGASKGDRTMLDSLIPACEAGLSAAETSPKDQAKAMQEAALKGAQETSQMKSAQAGRSAYVGETDLVGNVDPGSMAVAFVFEAIEKSIE